MNKNKVFERISYHVVYDDSIMDSIDFASKNGFSGIQIAMDVLHLGFDNSSNAEILRIKEKSQELGVRINLHAPDGASLVFPYSNTDKGIISYYSDLIDFAVKIGAKIITIHPGKPSHFPTDTVPQEIYPKRDLGLYKKILEKNLDRLLELSKGKVQLCIENYEWLPFVTETMQDYITRTDLGLCWDLEKMHNKPDGSVKTEILDFYTRNLSRIKQVHLHSIVEGKAHKVIQPGIIDFSHYLKLLDQVDVLDYCIEVRPKEKALESLNNLKKMLSYDK
ncbi:MAG: sugar phosphate isomerase/epimerase [Candidatus Micrarchaeota archaeon]|nr:sugar phosphate isomerase/epimerase [Candidatus Micrarchaeota archaeon]